MKFNYLLFGCFLLLIKTGVAQEYKTPFKQEVCSCMEEKSANNPAYSAMLEVALMQCYKEILPQFAEQMDATIATNDTNAKYREGQQLRQTLLADFRHELVLSCDYYFEKIESALHMQSTLLKQQATEYTLKQANQEVAMHPKAESFMKRGNLYILTENYPLGISDLQKAVSLSNNGYTARFQLASGLISAGNYNDAIAILDELISEKNNPNALVTRAYALRKSGVRTYPKKMIEPTKDVTIKKQSPKEVLKNPKSRNSRRGSSERTSNSTRNRRNGSSKSQEATKKPVDTTHQKLNRLFKIDNH